MTQFLVFTSLSRCVHSETFTTMRASYIEVLCFFLNERDACTSAGVARGYGWQHPLTWGHTTALACQLPSFLGLREIACSGVVVGLNLRCFLPSRNSYVSYKALYMDSN